MGEHKPVGGVELCELHFADSVEALSFESEGCDIEFADNGLEVRLMDDRSTFVERVECDKGVVKVAHTLHLVALRNDAQQWLDEEFVHRAVRTGVVARLTLNDGRRLIVGVSRHLTTEQPLRLESLVCDSGSAPSDSPTITLCLQSSDTALASAII